MNVSVAEISSVIPGCAARNRLTMGDKILGCGHNELLISEALKGRRREGAIISVKFGGLRDPAAGWTGIDARPEATKNFLAYSLQRLGVDHIDIYRPARLDPNVPIEETIGAIADMVKAGYVKHIGLSEVGSETIRRAAAVHPIVDLQIEYSLISRGIEDGILETCRELGIGTTAYGVLSRGLISGHWTKDRAGHGDFRAHSPQFQGGNVDKNWPWSMPCRKSLKPRALPLRRSPSPGLRHRARISLRWSVPAAATAWPRRSALSTSS